MEPLGSTNDGLKACKGKLNQVEVAIEKAKDNLASTPVNTLPFEVLDHIFHLVLAQQTCLLRASYRGLWDRPYFPKYPDVFTHVCSRWRQIALASHELWSHIDIHLTCNLSKGFNVRAKTYVTRAQEVPLDIHFIDISNPRDEVTECDSDSEQESSDSDFSAHEKKLWDREVRLRNPQEFTFLAASPLPPIRSLVLLSYQHSHSIHSRVLEYCLSNCLSGGLSKLVIDVPGSKDFDFFETNPIPQYPDSIPSGHFSELLTDQQFEHASGSVSTPSLNGRYHRWCSTAYHGLTDLRLLGGSAISELELTRILVSSPRLHILYCSFSIDSSSPSSVSTSPVVLPELEVLDLKSMDKESVWRFLGLLKTGLKSLRLSFRGQPTLALLENFIASSNIQEMHVVGPRSIIWGTQPVYSEFFLPPQLRTLALIAWSSGISDKTEETSLPPGLPNTAPFTGLDTLYMLSCIYDNFDHFRSVVAKCSPQRLVLWRCSIKGLDPGRPDQIDMTYLGQALGGNIERLCPSIEFRTDKEHSAVLDWD